MKAYSGALALFLLGGCTAGAIPPGQPAGPLPVPQAGPPAAGVIGLNAAGLLGQFGQPILDVREGTARKLQFGSQICVLDTFLYPPKSGRGEPVVTYTEARQRDGRPIDQTSCAAAIRAARGRR